MKHIMLMGLLAMSVLLLAVTPTQADFIQCPDGGCNGTDNADVINGSPVGDGIDGGLGNDFISGGDGPDTLSGNDGDDMIFGGLGSDYLNGDLGNDILVPGPDAAPNFMQCVDGGAGNDTTTVFVSETTGCLVINDGGGSDLVNLIGFGPYLAQKPFGLTGFTNDWIHLVDPVGGGDIFISIDETTDDGVEIINGLLTPNVTIVDVLPPECILDS